MYKLVQKLPKPVRKALKPFAAPFLDIARVRRRRAFALQYYTRYFQAIETWAKRHAESSNFYYSLTDANRQQLAHLLAVVLRTSPTKIRGYFDEIEGDQDLEKHFASAVRLLPNEAETVIRYGRRIGWYAFVRAMKPALVIETGVDHGVGACILASAILRNRAEGYAGKYYGLEIRPEAAQFFKGRYAEAGEILVGDSLASLRGLNEPIGLFINDSDHSADYEYKEYLEIRRLLAPSGVILGDNSHVTDRLAQFSEEENRSFIFFAEKPANHWYPGAGIGISFPREGAPA
jgi:hypothetical protein